MIEPLKFERNKMYYSIGEVAEMLQVTVPSIRFWEKEFPFITPQKTKGGTRFYSKSEIKNIQIVVYLLKVRRYTIEGAKQLLKNDRRNVEKKNEIYRRLERIKNEIQSLRQSFDVHLNIKGQEDGMDERD